jgi:Protein of unknown function (DUF3105)
MAEKPRVKAPKQRASSSRDPADRKRYITMGVALAGLVLGAAAVAAVLGFVGGPGRPGEADVRTKMQAAGCTLQSVKAQPGRHSLAPDGTADWNTDPPTSGPHFGFNPNGSVGTVIWGAYNEPVQFARLLHNLEHGGIYILYGDKVSAATVEKLRAFYDRHRNGTVLAPYPKLGDKTALGAWVAGSGETKGQLAKCGAFDEEALSEFFSAFQFSGPERFPSSSLLPGNT